jgi:hypothetical protein
MNADAKSTITPFIDTKGMADTERPLITFFNPAPKPTLTLRGVNGDSDRRYDDIGIKHLYLIESQFDELIPTPGVFVSEKSVVNGDPCEVRYVRFGQPRKTAGQQRESTAYRAYLLITPESIYPALQRINKLGQLRLKDGKHTEYKFRYPMAVKQKHPRLKEISNRQNEALYIDNAMDAIFTLYADTQEEILEIFQELTEKFGWQQLEDIKNETSLGINIRKPQKGTTRFAKQGSEFKTLEYNASPGFSENQ